MVKLFYWSIAYQHSVSQSVFQRTPVLKDVNRYCAKMVQGLTTLGNIPINAELERTSLWPREGDRVYNIM